MRAIACSLRDMLIAAAESARAAEKKPWPVNPFPPGIRTGSTTDRVLCALRARHPQFAEHYELMEETGASRGAIAWAIRYLLARGMVRAVPSARHPGYKRYQYQAVK